MISRTAHWAGWLSAALLMAGCTTPVQRAGENARLRQYLDQQAKVLGIDPAKPLTMAQCEQLALAGSLELRVQTMTLGLQDEQVRLAMSSGMPRASATFNDNTRNKPNMARAGPAVTEVSDRHTDSAAIQGVLPVLDWGLTYYSWKIATDRRRQARLVVDRSAQLLRRDVRVAYARHAGATRQVRLTEVAYQASAQVLRVAKSLEREHMTVPADTALVEAALAQAALDLSLARQRVEETHLNLSQLMSLPPGVQFTIDEALPGLPPVPSAEQLAAFEDQALKARPELTMQDLARQVSAAGVRQAAAAFFPRVDLTGNFIWTSESAVVNPAWFVGGFQVSHALLDGGATLWRYNIATKTVDIERQRSLLVMLGVLYEVEMRALRVRQSDETVAAARVLEHSRKIALARVISLYKEGLEDEAGAARSLADLTIQATYLDRFQTEYQVSWYELEATVLPADPPTIRWASSQPASQPTGGLLPTSLPAEWTQPNPTRLDSTRPDSTPATRPASQEGSRP